MRYSAARERTVRFAHEGGLPGLLMNVGSGFRLPNLGSRGCPAGFVFPCLVRQFRERVAQITATLRAGCGRAAAATVWASQSGCRRQIGYRARSIRQRQESVPEGTSLDRSLPRRRVSPALI